ncbi:hypothetical protein J2X02_002644 [Pseudoxanthomonas japonensis]|uniref:hypothetical protein n=1 Tax=Pseudoxanthomonas japonensis TaxID=69284 RepID=UPI0028544B09|nr:hypothetical protein [Pseudoxanthomonas japonensis]MDR7069793.1 hypothetical protein [Pseudoxanthomonas japonensis]
MSIHVERRQAMPDDMALLDRHWLSPRWHAALTSIAMFFLLFVLACGLLLSAAAIVLGMENPLRSLGIDVDFDFVPNLWQKVLLIAALWGPVFIVPAMLAVRRYQHVKAQRLEVWNDRHEGGIEVIDAAAAAYTTVQSGHSLIHLHLFEVRPGDVLCLASDNYALAKQRAVLMDELDAQEDDLSYEDAEAFMEARLPVFPSTRFTVHRWHHTGIVVRLDPQGEPLAPARVVHLHDLPSNVARALEPMWLRDSGWVAMELQPLR